MIPASHERNWIEWPFNPALFDGIDNYLGQIKPAPVNNPAFNDVGELPSTTAQNGGVAEAVSDATTVLRF